MDRPLGPVRETPFVNPIIFTNGLISLPALPGWNVIGNYPKHFLAESMPETAKTFLKCQKDNFPPIES